jgi:hypothetical protein
MSRKKKPSVTLAGTVEKIIPEPFSKSSEKAEISISDADPLYKEIRIENKLEDEEGKEVAIKPGAEVDVTIEAEPEATRPKKTPQSELDNTSEISKTETGKEVGSR